MRALQIYCERGMIMMILDGYGKVAPMEGFGGGISQEGYGELDEYDGF